MSSGYGRQNTSNGQPVQTSEARLGYRNVQQSSTYREPPAKDYGGGQGRRNLLAELPSGSRQNYSSQQSGQRIATSQAQQGYSDDRRDGSQKSGPSPVVSGSAGSRSKSNGHQNPGKSRGTGISETLNRYLAEEQRRNDRPDAEAWKPIGSFRYGPSGGEGQERYGSGSQR